MTSEKIKLISGRTQIRSAPEKDRNLVVKNVLLVFLLASMVFASCNPEEWEILDCAGCLTEKPENAEINVKLTLNNLNPEVVINIYSGRIEEEILILSDTARSELWTTVLPAGEYYTLTANYRSGVHTAVYYNVTAIDGGFVRAEMVRARCDKPCWVIRGNSFNLKLKN